MVPNLYFPIKWQFQNPIDQHCNITLSHKLLSFHSDRFPKNAGCGPLSLAYKLSTSEQRRLAATWAARGPSQDRVQAARERPPETEVYRGSSSTAKWRRPAARCPSPPAHPSHRPAHALTPQPSSPHHPAYYVCLNRELRFQ
nr:uncharacterized protein LOC128683562 [Plodia interpunctella]